MQLDYVERRWRIRETGDIGVIPGDSQRLAVQGCGVGRFSFFGISRKCRRYAKTDGKYDAKETLVALQTEKFACHEISA